MEITNGAQNQLASRVRHEFLPRFAPFGHIVWLLGSDTTPAGLAAQWLRRVRLDPAAVEQLPHIVIRDVKLRRLWLIDLPALGRQMTSEARDALKGVLKNTAERPLFANALENRQELTSLVANSVWGTIAWFADEPDHIVVFDESVDPRILGPAS